MWLQVMSSLSKERDDLEQGLSEEASRLLFRGFILISSPRDE